MVVASLIMLCAPVHATIVDFKDLADGSLGESAWSTLMFEADGSHTLIASDAFLSITGTNGANSYAYLDANNAGLGVCGTLLDSSTANKANPNSGTNLCNPGSDDNVTNHNDTPETLHFVFDEDVVIDKIWLNNNHDGDRSLLNDYVEVDGTATLLTNGGVSLDSVLALGLLVQAGTSFDLGFYAGSEQICGDSQYDNCEFYVSKIEFSSVPEPSTIALLGLGLAGIGIARRRKQ